eukprot:2619866-Prymnesium_polylepis.1
MRCAHASPNLSTKALFEHLNRVNESTQLPQWLEAARATRREGVLDLRQVTSLLLDMCTSSATLTRIFDGYAANGVVAKDEWLSFVKKEQLPVLPGAPDQPPQRQSAQPAEDSALVEGLRRVSKVEVNDELASARLAFERMARQTSDDL